MKVNKKEVDQKFKDLQTVTWDMVKNVASNEKSNNGRMLYIAQNTFLMFENNQLDFSNYFDKSANDTSAKKIFFDGDERKTLIAKDYGKFVNQVLVPAMGQNLADIQVKSPYEYRVLTDVSPLVMFMICNADVYKNGEFLNEETDPVEFRVFKKVFSVGKNDIESERVFKEGLFENFFQKAEKGKDYYCTFRGERGVIEFVKQYFMPKKIASENVANAVESPLYKAMIKINDLEKGSLGTTHHLTNVAKAEQGKGGNADQRLMNEVAQIKTSAEKFIDLLAKNDNPIAQKGLLDIHLYIIEKLEDQNFKDYIKGKTKANLKFFPTINNKEFDSISGDFYKYVSNFK
tara:strand:- start:277 stop:1314 length:1038 start_codon:yes stop_codon:yes gene_type:complete